jgi:integrase/recombinase XerD
MPKERFSWTEPALCHYDYDTSKAWFVYFTFCDTRSGATRRVQSRKGINNYKSRDERLKKGNALVKWWKRELEGGWNPFVQGEVKKLPIHYTISEAVERVLALKLPTLRKRAKETYTYMHKSFQEWLRRERLDTVALGDFSPGDASRYMDYLIVEKGYAGRTHNDHLIVLKSFYNAMMERKWCTESPFKGIKNREVEVGRNLAYTEEEKDRLKNLLYERDRDVYYLSQIMYYCFIRRSELALLRVGDIDLQNHTITIPADVSKNKTQESVVIPVGLEKVLGEMQLHKYPAHYYLFGRRLVRSALQYKNVNHISTRHNKFLTQKYLKDKAIDPAKGLYSWKHTGVCTAYYATGKDVYAVMRQLRHRDLNTTQIYLKSLGLVQNDVFRNSMTA